MQTGDIGEDLGTGSDEPRRAEPETQQTTGEDAEQVQDEEPFEEKEFQSVGKVKPVPRSPSAEEARLHRATHVPFRSWCIHCIKGQSQASLHSATCYPCGNLESTDVPTVSADYMFMTSSSA